MTTLLPIPGIGVGATAGLCVADLARRLGLRPAQRERRPAVAVAEPTPPTA